MKKSDKLIMHCNGQFVTHKKQPMFFTAARLIYYAFFVINQVDSLAVAAA